MEKTNTEIQVFNYDQKQVRTKQIDGEPWFVLKDVCAVLGLSTPARVAERLDSDEVSQTHLTDSLGREQETTIISESGLYNVILRSDKPEAKPFRKWVTSEVLPSIRQHGAYMTPDTLDQMISSPEFGIRLLTELKAEQDKNRELRADNSKLSAENAVLSPKADYFDELVERGSLMNFRETAKELGISPKKMTSFLVEKKYLYRNQHGQLLPYEAKNKGYFELKESYNAKTDWTGTQTLVTVKGRDMLRQLNIL